MRTDFLKFAHAAGKLDLAAGVPGLLTEMAAADPASSSGRASVVHDLAAASVDHPDLFKEPGAAAELAAADAILGDIGPVGVGSNDVLLARWAFSGSLDPLTELLRRFLHRDGSSESIVLGSDAMALVIEAEQADPVFLEALKAARFSPVKVRMGVFPAGSFSLPLALVPVQHTNPRRVQAGQSTPAAPSPSPSPFPLPSGGSQAAAAIASAPAGAVEVIPATPATPARRARAVPAGSGNTAVADMAAGTVKLGGASLSISAAIKAGDSITRAVVELLRPAEAFAWLDDNHDPQSRSILVDLDGVRGKGLPEVGGGLLQGEVLQIPSRGPDPEAGKYLGRIYNRGGGFTEFATGVDDVNAAKFQVAERVRQELKTPA